MDMSQTERDETWLVGRTLEILQRGLTEAPMVYRDHGLPKDLWKLSLPVEVGLGCW